jgi:hypothetical protein
MFGSANTVASAAMRNLVPLPPANEARMIVNHSSKTQGIAMSKVISKTTKVLALSSSLLLIGVGVRSALAEDAVVVAPNHYKVEFENDKVRIIRITYAPCEESAMHDHKNGVVVNLANYSVQFTAADGTKLPVETSTAGTFQWAPADMHAAKNVGTARAEALYIELKN